VVLPDRAYMQHAIISAVIAAILATAEVTAAIVVADGTFIIATVTMVKRRLYSDKVWLGNI
jgi:hypothetical protein